MDYMLSHLTVERNEVKEEVSVKLWITRNLSYHYQDNSLLTCSRSFYVFVAGYGEERAAFKGGKNWSEGSIPSWAPGSLKPCCFSGVYAELSRHGAITAYQHLCCCSTGRIQSSGSERKENKAEIDFSSVWRREVWLQLSGSLLGWTPNVLAGNRTNLVSLKTTSRTGAHHELPHW